MSEIKVLLIDDETDYSETMGFYLMAKGYKVRTASSGRAGIEEIKRDRPDIVFLDFLMPEMDGIDTLKEIRSFDKGLQVIMVTAYASDEKMQTAQGYGIFGIFPKAADFTVAAKLIGEALKKLPNNSPPLAGGD